MNHTYGIQIDAKRTTPERQTTKSRRDETFCSDAVLTRCIEKKEK
jgi:hypothetical protein